MNNLQEGDAIPDLVPPDADRSALEPVQTIGRIQPHGVLFGISGPDLVVRQVSTNGEPVRKTCNKTEARILLAEDNRTDREVTLAQLRKLGYNASAVSNGVEVLEALQPGCFELVLMDCGMPVMDGFAATRVIRASVSSDIPIIALTADFMQSDRDRCLDAGMNDYLLKPTDLGQLANAIAKWLPVFTPGTDKTSGPLTGEEIPPPFLNLPATVVFNADDLLWRLMGDRHLAGIVVKGFLEDAPRQLSNLRKRLDENDAAGIRALAHTLRGASATVAAEDLNAVAEAMELAGTSGQMHLCRQLLLRAIEEFERYASALQRAGWA